MRIAIDVDNQFDGKALGTQRFTGVQNYVDSLLNALYARESVHEITAFAPTLGSRAALEKAVGDAPFAWQRHSRARVDVGDVIEPLPARSTRLRSLVRHLKRRFYSGAIQHPDGTLRVRAASRKYDLLHLPCPLPFLEAFDTGCRVATVYDLTTKIYPWTHDPVNRAAWDHYHHYLRAHCARILAISSATKQDIVEHLGIPEDRVDVTPLAARVGTEHIEDPQRLRETLDSLGPFHLDKTPFVLYAGTLEPRKNLERLIDAFAQVLREEPALQHRLVLAGGNWNRHDLELRLFALERGIGGRVVVPGYVSSDQLNALMSGCDAFAYVSLYEGFGLPVLEAMFCGAPVLVSNTSSLPEVVGDAGLQVSPGDTDAIARGLHGLLTDREENTRRRSLSLCRAGCFSWERTAALTLNSYEAAFT